MSLDNLLLIYASLALASTIFLIALNNVREDAESKMQEPLDFTSYLRKKSKGDVIDQLIAEQLGNEKIAA